MKISRQASARRRRSPFPILLILAALVLIGLLAFAWVRGGEQPTQPVEIDIPANQLGN